LDYYYIIYGKGQAQVLAAPEVVGAADNEWWHRHRHLFFPCSTLVFFLPEFSSLFFRWPQMAGRHAISPGISAVRAFVIGPFYLVHRSGQLKLVCKVIKTIMWRSSINKRQLSKYFASIVTRCGALFGFRLK